MIIQRNFQQSLESNSGLRYTHNLYHKFKIFNKHRLLGLYLVSGMSLTTMTYALSERSSYDIEISPSVYTTLELSKTKMIAFISYPGLRKGSICGVTLAVEASRNNYQYRNALEQFSNDIEVYENNEFPVRMTSFIDTGYNKDSNYIFKRMSGDYIGHVTFQTKSGKTFGESWKEALSKQSGKLRMAGVGLIPILCKKGGEETGLDDAISVLDE